MGIYIQFEKEKKSIIISLETKGRHKVSEEEDSGREIGGRIARAVKARLRRSCWILQIMMHFIASYSFYGECGNSHVEKTYSLVLDVFRWSLQIHLHLALWLGGWLRQAGSVCWLGVLSDFSPKGGLAEERREGSAAGVFTAQLHPCGLHWAGFFPHWKCHLTFWESEVRYQLCLDKIKASAGLDALEKNLFSCLCQLPEAACIPWLTAWHRSHFYLSCQVFFSDSDPPDSVFSL